MIHKYKLNNYNIIVDVNSGSIHVVDEVVYDIIDNITLPLTKECPKNILVKLDQLYNNQEIKSAYEEIYKLYVQDLLFSKDEYHLAKEKLKPSPIKAMCLHVAHDCNLRCTYCFASTGDFGGGRKLMSLDIGQRAVDFLIKHSKNRKNLEIDFFGGEPLMNMETVKQIVAYARNKEKLHNKIFRFTITTNGVLLNDEYIDFLNKEMHNIVLSIDGRKEINDKIRPRVDGTGCYDAIINNYKKLVNQRDKQKDYYVRGTFTKHNLDFTKDVIHLYDCGFEQISIEPVVSSDSTDYSISESDLPTIFNEYENLAKQIINFKKNGKCFNFFHFMLDLDDGPCAIKRLKGCGSGNEYVAVTPEGHIYPCHQFVGMDTWKMGDLNFSDQIDANKKEFFSKTTIYEKNTCNKCWAKFYCSGGCNANNFQYNNDVFTPNKTSCDMMRKRIECAIMIKAATIS